MDLPQGIFDPASLRQTATEFRLRLEEERLCDDCGITTDEMVVRLSE